jgi:membrane-bound serine protease (ClpP class)
VSWFLLLGILSSGGVNLLKFSGVVSPPTASYITQGIRYAEEVDAECLIIQIDTPGGLDESMRQIIKGIMDARVPVVSWVAPAGARAASAGVFIVLSSHIAAMASGTNIGAAHPVALGGEMDSTMIEKVTNDAVAYIRGIAESRGRNAEWAERSVRESISSSAQEAHSLRVVDLVVNSLPELLEALDGRRVRLDSGYRVLKTSGAEVHERPMPWYQRFLAVLANPNVAYILLILGIYGILFEFQNPGAIFPGAVGAVSLILAFYSLQILPVNYAGVALIALALILFVLEFYITSYGMLTLGGTTALVLGSLLLFNSPQSSFRVSTTLIIVVAALAAGFLILVLCFGVRAHLRRPITGKEGLVGGIGIAKTELSPSGTVLVQGELWQATSNEPVAKDEPVEVIGIEGMVLKVKPTKRR